jgi:hypothetical protein
MGQEWSRRTLRSQHIEDTAYSIEVESYGLDGEVIFGERRTRQGIRSRCDSSRTGDNRLAPDRIGSSDSSGCSTLSVVNLFGTAAGRLARHV